MRKHSIGIVLGALLLMGGGCDRRPVGVLSTQQFADLLADLNVADAYLMTEGFPGMSRSGYAASDSLNKIMRQSVMRQHGVSEAQFAQTLDWYGRNLDRYEEVCELSMASLELRRAASKGVEAPGTQTDNLWRQGISIRMGGTTGRDTITFSLPDAGLEKGDRLELSFNTTSLGAPLTAVIAADYTDGSSTLSTSTITGGARSRASLQLDSTLTPKSVYGYIVAQQPTMILLDSITMRRMPLNSVKYYDIHSQRTLPPKR